MLNNYLSKIDAARRNNLLTITSKNNNKSVTYFNFNKCANIQSAENCKEFSETIRQISNLNNEDNLFFNRLAGIIDGDGNFDLRKLKNKLVLKAIRIKLHNRDIRILTYIQNTLHIGRIRADKNKPHSL
jgi:LAGLIDADG endonuclease